MLSQWVSKTKIERRKLGRNIAAIVYIWIPAPWHRMYEDLLTTKYQRKIKSMKIHLTQEYPEYYIDFDPYQ